MDLVYFIILKSQQSFSTLVKSPKAIAYNLFLLLFTVVLALGFGNILFLAETGMLPVNHKIVKFVVFLIIGLLTLSKVFIPYYRPLVRFIPLYYPVFRYKVTLYNIINDFTSAYYIFTVLFILFLTIYSHSFKVIDLISCMSLLYGCRFITRIIQNLLEYKIRFTFWTTIIILSSISLIVYLLVTFSLSQIRVNVMFLLFILLLLLIINISIESFDKEERLKNQLKSIDKSTIFSTWKLLLNNVAFRTSLLLAVAIKVFFITSIVISTFSEDKQNDGLYIWVFLSPFLLFAFIFNNLWGFFKNIWLYIFLVGNELKQYVKFFLIVLFFPLLIDVVITGTFFIIINKDLILNVINYVLITSMFIVFGFLMSLLYPKYVMKKFEFKQNTSYIGSLFFLILLFSIVYYSSSNYLLYIAIGSIIIEISLILFIKFKFKYRNIYTELFRT